MNIVDLAKDCGFKDYGTEGMLVCTATDIERLVEAVTVHRFGVAQDSITRTLRESVAKQMLSMMEKS